MNEKFAGIPVEPDTAVLVNTAMEFEGIECVFQIWLWDGIQGQSLIFLNEEVAAIDDESLKAKVRSWIPVADESDVTISRSGSGFTFVNFNFTTEEED